jgi:hypothetical protein
MQKDSISVCGGGSGGGAKQDDLEWLRGEESENKKEQTGGVNRRTRFSPTTKGC